MAARHRLYDAAVFPRYGSTCARFDNRAASVRCTTLASIRLYALVQAGDPEAIDVYLSEEDAQRALQDCLFDEPEWRGLVRLAAIELDASVSPN